MVRIGQIHQNPAWEPGIGGSLRAFVRGSVVAEQAGQFYVEACKLVGNSSGFGQGQGICIMHGITYGFLFKKGFEIQMIRFYFHDSCQYLILGNLLSGKFYFGNNLLFFVNPKLAA